MFSRPSPITKKGEEKYCVRLYRHDVEKQNEQKITRKGWKNIIILSGDTHEKWPKKLSISGMTAKTKIEKTTMIKTKNYTHCNIFHPLLCFLTLPQGKMKSSSVLLSLSVCVTQSWMEMCHVRKTSFQVERIATKRPCDSGVMHKDRFSACRISVFLHNTYPLKCFWKCSLSSRTIMQLQMPLMQLKREFLF